MMLALSFALEKLDKLNFQNFIPYFFPGTVQDFFLKSNGMNWATNLKGSSEISKKSKAFLITKILSF